MPTQEELSALFRKIIILNELGGNMKYVLEFSDPDGVRTGRSGWSFGAVQMDLNNNPDAALCLKECEFTDAEIAGLKSQTIDPKPLEAKLREHADIIEKYDDKQLSWCLDHAQSLLNQYRDTATDTTAFLTIADMANQYSPKTTGLAMAYLSKLGRPFMGKDVLDFKLSFTDYGKKNSGDCRRRYMNVLKVVQNG